LAEKKLLREGRSPDEEIYITESYKQLVKDNAEYIQKDKIQEDLNEK